MASSGVLGRRLPETYLQKGTPRVAGENVTLASRPCWKTILNILWREGRKEKSGNYETGS